MTRKRIVYLGLLLLGFSFLLPSADAAHGKLTSSTFESQKIYYGRSPLSTSTINVTVSTSSGVSYGVYTLRGGATFPGYKIPLTSWSGAGSAPTLIVDDHDSADESKCPGLDTTYFLCALLTVDIVVEADNYGCPWIASTTGTTTITTIKEANNASYTGLPTRGSMCPKVPVDTYDVSWDPNVLKHDTVLSIDPTNSTVKSTLQTYLMESGMLCDKSKMDSRGAYCRFIGTGVTLTVKGCDNGNVTTFASPHSLTEIGLHEIVVSVNTKNMTSGKSTCSYQYVLEQL